MLNALKRQAETGKKEAVGAADHANANGLNRAADGILARFERAVKFDFAARLAEAGRALESLKHAPTIRCGVCGRQESTASQAFFLNGQPACSSCFAEAHKEWLRERRRLLKGARG